MSQLNVDTIKKADGTGSLTVPAETGTVVTTASPSLGRRNLIINGAMQIHQRTGTITVNSGWKYTLDRFRGYANTSDGVYTVEQSTTAPDGFYKSCKITVTTADSSIGSTQLYMFGTALEGNDIQRLNWGTASPETVTLSFWVRSSLTGTFGVTITQGDTGNPSYPASYTISSADTWEHKTITIDGPTVGTWAAGTSATLQINFDLGCGADNRGTAGSWINTGNTRYGTTGATDVIATNGATLYLTGVQLEVGSVATPFEHRSYGEELALCQRYAFVINGDQSTNDFPIAMVHWYGSNYARGYIYFPVSMRTGPSLIETQGSNYYRVITAGSNYYTTNLVTTQVKTYATGLYSNQFSGTATSGYAGEIFVDSSDGKLVFDAEL